MNIERQVHNRKSIRLKEYDYSKGSYYFVTVCTFNRLNLLGKIENGNIKLNQIGEVIDGWIHKLNEHFPNSSVDYYCIMPNHIHIIIILDEPFFRKGGVTPPLPSLGNVVAYLKYQSTKEINLFRKMPFQKVWHRNYYEHIIRNDKDLYEIRNYIQNNPLEWEDDEYYKE